MPMLEAYKHFYENSVGSDLPFEKNRILGNNYCNYLTEIDLSCFRKKKNITRIREACVANQIFFKRTFQMGKIRS